MQYVAYVFCIDDKYVARAEKYAVIAINVFNSVGVCTNSNMLVMCTAQSKTK